MHSATEVAWAYSYNIVHGDPSTKSKLMRKHLVASVKYIATILEDIATAVVFKKAIAIIMIECVAIGVNNTVNSKTIAC